MGASAATAQLAQQQHIDATTASYSNLNIRESVQIIPWQSCCVCCHDAASTAQLLLPNSTYGHRSSALPILRAAAECDQRECTGGRTCHMFGIKGAKTADGKTQADMNVCLQSPQVRIGNPVDRSSLQHCSSCNPLACVHQSACSSKSG